jgi:hypothetical protein
MAYQSIDLLQTYITLRYIILSSGAADMSVRAEERDVRR